MSVLEQLLVVQEHDSALDQLRHRRATLPAREVLVRSEAAVRDLSAPTADARDRRDAVTRDVQRLEDSASAAAAKVEEVEKAMYSGSVTSPRELQAMQADVDQLQRHRRVLEDRELELMERQEEIDTELAALEGRLTGAETEIGDARRALASEEAAIDADIAAEQTRRDEAANLVPDNLLALYERCRARARGVGVARLVGSTCQGCRLTIPATEVAQIRKADPDDVAHCDNCGAILVLAR